MCTQHLLITVKMCADFRFFTTVARHRGHKTELHLHWIPAPYADHKLFSDQKNFSDHSFCIEHMNGKIIKSALPCLSRRCQTLPPTRERLPWLSLKWLCPLQSPIMLAKHTLGLRLLHQVFRNLPLGGPTCSMHSLKSSRQPGHLAHRSRHRGKPLASPKQEVALAFSGLGFHVFICPALPLWTSA